MAVTYTSTLQPQHHRELVLLIDQYGATSKLYVHASQVASRASIIQARVSTMEKNEANMTALAAACSTSPPS